MAYKVTTKTGYRDLSEAEVETISVRSVEFEIDSKSLLQDYPDLTLERRLASYKGDINTIYTHIETNYVTVIPPSMLLTYLVGIAKNMGIDF